MANIRNIKNKVISTEKGKKITCPKIVLKSEAQEYIEKVFKLMRVYYQKNY